MSTTHEPNSPRGAPPGAGDTTPGAGMPQLVPLDPRVRMVWWVSGALVLLQVTIVVSLIDLLAPLPLRSGLATAAVVAVGGVAVAVLPVIRYRRWGYALRERDLWIRQGVFWRSVSVIPYARLQFVDTRQGPLDRLFGLSQLVVHTAALGTSGQLPGLDAAEAERLRERLGAVESDVLAV